MAAERRRTPGLLPPERPAALSGSLEKPMVAGVDVAAVSGKRAVVGQEPRALQVFLPQAGIS